MNSVRLKAYAVLRSMTGISRGGVGLIAVPLLAGGFAISVFLAVYFWPTASALVTTLDTPSSQLWHQLGISASFDTARSQNPALTSMYPGRFIAPKDWRESAYTGANNFGPAPGLPAGFMAIEKNQVSIQQLLGVDDQHGDIPLKFSIPALKLNSRVEQLARPDSNGNGRVDDGDGPYPNPVGVVGYIDNPDQNVTSFPGQSASGWYFGHLENLDEGNVFRNLPQISTLVRDEPVDVFIETDTAIFMYRVKSTLEIGRDMLEPDIFWPSVEERSYLVYMVTCWPPKNYTRRFVAVAELTAYKLKAPAPIGEDQST